MTENINEKKEDFLFNEKETSYASNKRHLFFHVDSAQKKTFLKKSHSKNLANQILKNQSQKNISFAKVLLKQNQGAKPMAKSQNIKTYSSPFRHRINSLQKKRNLETLNGEQHTHSVETNEVLIKKSQVDSKKQNLYSSYSKFHELKLVSVGLASAEKIRMWAEKTLPNGKVLGQVNTANTLHHKTFKPQKGGLFCERIFGPLKDFECACGQTQRPNDDEYKKLLYRQYDSTNVRSQIERKFCPNCDVEYTWSIIRRYQMGYIQLVSPVSHLWYLKANPSYLSLLLDMKRKNLENVIYCSETMTLENTWKSTQNFGMSLGTECSPTVLFSTWKQLVAEQQTYRKFKSNEQKIRDFKETRSEKTQISHEPDFFSNQRSGIEISSGEKKDKNQTIVENHEISKKKSDFFEEIHLRKKSDPNLALKNKAVEKKITPYIIKKMNLRKGFFSKTQRFSISTEIEKTDTNGENRKNTKEMWRNFDSFENRRFSKKILNAQKKSLSISFETEKNLKKSSPLNLVGVFSKHLLFEKTPTKSLKQNQKKSTSNSNVEFIDLSDVNLLKQKAHPIKKIIKFVENRRFGSKNAFFEKTENINNDNLEYNRKNHSLRTLYLLNHTLNKIAIPGENDFDKKKFHLILQSIWKKFYKVVYRSAQLKSSTISYRTKIEEHAKIKNEKRKYFKHCFNNELVFLRRIHLSRKHSKNAFLFRAFPLVYQKRKDFVEIKQKSDFLKNNFDRAVYELDFSIKNQMARIKNDLKFYMDDKNVDLSEIALWSLLSFFNKIELTDLKWIKNKKDVSLINLIFNLDEHPAFFRVHEENASKLENHEKNMLNSKKKDAPNFFVPFDSSQIDDLKKDSKIDDFRRYKNIIPKKSRKTFTSLKTLIRLIKFSFKLHLIDCSRKMYFYFENKKNRKTTFSFMNNLCCEWFKKTKSLMNLLVEKLAGFLVKYKFQREFYIEFIISNELGPMNETLTHASKIYCLRKSILSDNYVTHSEPYVENHKFSSEESISVDAELRTSSLSSKLLTLLKKSILNEILLPNDIRKKQKNFMLLNVKLFDEMQKVFMIQQQVIMKKSDSSMKLYDRLAKKLYIENETSNDSILSNDRFFDMKFLLYYCGILRTTTLSSKESYNMNSFSNRRFEKDRKEDETKDSEKLSEKINLFDGSENKRIFRTYGSFSSNIWNQKKHKHLLSVLYSVLPLVDQKPQAKSSSFALVKPKTKDERMAKGQLSENRRFTMTFSSRALELNKFESCLWPLGFTPALGFHPRPWFSPAPLVFTCGENGKTEKRESSSLSFGLWSTKDKKNMRRKSKITHRYNLIKKEFSYTADNRNKETMNSSSAFANLAFGLSSTKKKTRDFPFSIRPVDFSPATNSFETRKFSKGQKEHKKHRIFNNVYCLSHRYCWNLERNWQYFYYYNSARGDFDDRIIPRYKHRIVDGNLSNDINVDNTIAGAGIIQKLLSELNPKELRKMDKQNRILLYELNKKISKLKNLAKKGLAEKIEKKQLKQSCEKRDQLIRRTKLVRKLFRKNSNPDSMILTALPVLPPDLRPILKMQDQIAASDLNRLYQRVIYRNDRLRKFLKDPAISNSFEMKYAQRLLQEAVDNLIQNGKGGIAPERDSRGRALKSLSEILKGKQGRFRQYLLGKRVDYSGRSVIVVGPRLKLHECGLPKEMARELFLPFLIKRILHYKLARTVIGAKTIIKTNEILTDQLLREILQSHPILLNRAPTLHRLGIQAFQPLLIEGRAILLHPLVCPAFNADFDGDQMAVHVPLTVEARSEAWKLMFSRNNLISPATGEPIMLPSQDMVLGCYYLTTEISQNMRDQWIAFRENQRQKALLSSDHEEKQNQSSLVPHSREEGLLFESSLWSTKGEKARLVLAERNSEKMSLFSRYMLAFCFSNLDQVMIAYQQKQIDVHTSIWVVWNNSLEVANEISQPLEIRLNLQGYWQEIRFKSFCRFDCTGFKLNRMIRTTAGRVLLNKIFYSCIK